MPIATMAEIATWQERAPLSRPARLGTRRRRPKAGASGAGASWPAGPPSLDTDKQLQTTDRNCREWLNSQLTEQDLYTRQISLHGQLLSAYHQLWQDYQAAANHAEAVKWEKKWLRVHNCRTEWVGYQAECCLSQSPAIAVPVGCNDRLCPLCAWDRSRVARKRIKTMFDRLAHPVLITLTVPNVPLRDERGNTVLRKHHYTLFRQRVRQFLAQHKRWIKGGVYSLETTFNRADKSWHIHVHILADVASALPPKSERITVAGRSMCLFTANKLRLEFDWLRLWTAARGKKARSNASEMRRNGDLYDFEQWVSEGFEHRVRVWSNRDKRYVPDPTLSRHELMKRTAWNVENRRVIDIRPVTDRDGAAREVLKYITKVADFSDIPEAVEGFSNAVRGTRLIQTFGSWYGVKLDTPTDPNEPRDWGEMRCACGCNFWKAFGVLYRRDVEMDVTGRWLVKPGHNPRYGGSVARPTIRADMIARGKRSNDD